jgi:hypothetical protein
MKKNNPSLGVSILLIQKSSFTGPSDTFPVSPAKYAAHHLENNLFYKNGVYYWDQRWIFVSTNIESFTVHKAIIPSVFGVSSKAYDTIAQRDASTSSDDDIAFVIETGEYYIYQLATWHNIDDPQNFVFCGEVDETALASAIARKHLYLKSG